MIKGFSLRPFKQFLSLFTCIHLIFSPYAFALDSSTIHNITTPHSQDLLHTPDFAPTLSNIEPSMLDSTLPNSLESSLPSQPNLAQQNLATHTNITNLENLDSALTLKPTDSMLNQLESTTNTSTHTFLSHSSIDSAQAIKDSHTNDLPSPIDSLPQTINTQPHFTNIKNLDSTYSTHSPHANIDSPHHLAITPDTSIPSYTPTISHSPNGIEIVEITTPNAKGISNNHYIDFNIKPQGVILNNSLESITHTQLAGLITSNPHLHNNTASLILNQVTSHNPSHLLGLLEVAGDRASVLIANPNGILCKSCGFSNVANLTLSTALIRDKLALDEQYFNHANSPNAPNSFHNTNTLINKYSINASNFTNSANSTTSANSTNSTRATLTTNTNTTHQSNTIHQTNNTNHNNINTNTASANTTQHLKEQLSDNLKARVQKGHINIDALNASNTNHLTILAKSLKINKHLYAKDLLILLGNNDIALDDKGALLLWQPLEVRHLQTSNLSSYHSTSNNNNASLQDTKSSISSSFAKRDSGWVKSSNDSHNANNINHTQQHHNKDSTNATNTTTNTANKNNKSNPTNTTKTTQQESKSALMQDSSNSTNTQESTNTNNTNTTNEVLALDVAYLGGVFANSIYLIASDENTIASNKGIMATLPSTTNGDNGFYIDINGRLEIASATDTFNHNAGHISNTNLHNPPPFTSKTNPYNQTISQTPQSIAQSHTNHNPSLQTSTHLSHLSIDSSLYSIEGNSNNQSNNTTNNTISNSANNINPPKHTIAISSKDFAHTSNNNPLLQHSTHLSIDSSLPNKSAREIQPSIYSSNNLLIAAKSLTNTNSLIYANNALDIRADSLANNQGTIYAGRTLNIHTNALQNLGYATTKNELESKQWITQGNLTKVGDKHFWRSVYIDRLDSFSPSIIASNGNVYINANTLNNHNSYISANDSLQINATTSNNTQTKAYQTIKEQGREVRNYQYTYWEDYAGVWGSVCGFITFGICNIRQEHTITLQGIFPYSPPHSKSSISLDFPTLQAQLERESKITNASTNIAFANELIRTTNPLISFSTLVKHKNPTQTISNLATPIAYTTPYDDFKTFIKSNYFYDSFAKRDSSQAKVFLSNLDIASKAMFFNSTTFLNNALDSHSLHTNYEHTLKQDRLKEQFTNLNNDISHATHTYQNLIHSNLANSIGFSANTLSINASDFTNTSMLLGENLAINATDSLNHLGNIQANDIILQSNGLLHINGGSIDSSGNAYLQAKNINIDSAISTTYGYAKVQNQDTINTSHDLFSRFFYPKYPKSFTNPFHSQDSLTSTANINANNLSIIAKDSASIATSSLQANDLLTINANNINLTTQTLASSYKDSYQTHNTTTALGTHLSANNISLDALNSLNLTNSTLHTDSNLMINARGNISLDSATDTTYTQTTQHTRDQNLFYTKDTTTTTTTQSTTQKGNTLLSNGNLSIKANNNINAYNLTAIAHNDITLESKQGNILLSSKANTYSQHIAQSIIERGFKGSLSDLSISYGVDKTNIDSAKSHSLYDKSLIYGNNISINTNKNARLESVDLSTYERDLSNDNVANLASNDLYPQHQTNNIITTTSPQNTHNNISNNTISINANNLTMDYLSNTYKESYTSTTESHRVGLKASVPILSPALNATHSLDSLLNKNTSSPLHSTKAKTLASLNASLDIADLGLDISKAINKDFNAKLSLSYTTTIATQQSNSTQTKALDSAINTSTLSINTLKDTTLRGTNIHTSNTTDIQATNFTLESSKDTFSHTQASTLDSISVGASISFGTNGLGVNAEASYDNSRSHSSLSSTSYNHSHINTHSFNLTTSNNTNILGSSIKAKSLSMDIGNTLDITSLQDSTAYSASSHSLSLNASIPVYGASLASAEANYSTSSTKANLSTTTTLASINADSLSINTNHTNLTSSSILGNGNLHTNTLTHSNLANTSSYETHSTSIGTNGGYFLNNADSSKSSALATISNGIDIASPDLSSLYNDNTSSLKANNAESNNPNPSLREFDLSNSWQSIKTNTNASLPTSLLSLNRDTNKNNNITLKDYTQTAIDKEQENHQVISLANTLKGKVNSLKQDIKDIANIDDDTTKGINTNLSVNAITEGIITGIVTQDFLSTATAIANPYIANSIKHITQDNPNLSPKAQLITNVLAHSAYGALAGGLFSQSIDSLSSITSSNTTLLNSMLSGGLSAGSAPLIARLASNALYDTDDTSSLSAKQQEVIKSIVSLSGGIIGASVSNTTDSSNAFKYASIGANQAINEVENNSFTKALRVIGYPALKLYLDKGTIPTLQELALITKNAKQEISDELESIIANPLSLKTLDSSIGFIAGIKPSEVADGFNATTNYIKRTNFSNVSAPNDTSKQTPPISLDENADKLFTTTIPKSNHKQNPLTQIPSHTKTTQDTITTLPKHTKDTPIITTPSTQEIGARVYLSGKASDEKPKFDGIYENAPYHGKQNNGLKNKAPRNGQEALENSIRINENTERRISVHNGEFVVLDKTKDNVFHGHIRSWKELTQDMRNTLQEAGLVTPKGKIK